MKIYYNKKIYNYKIKHSSKFFMMEISDDI